MECPQCGLANPPGTSVCTACSTPLPDSDRTLALTDPAPATLASERTMDDVSGWSVPAEPPAGAAGVSGALQPGRVLGNRYEILQVLGEGGMGAVYKARDRELDRLVALKVIRPEFAQNPDVLRRFKQELILARQVTHRNVIRIFDLGEADGIKFITMEFIEGHDLKTLLRESGKFEPRKASEIVEQVCRALDAAHTEGVIHRDLKPQNIMVDAHGKVSVMDFGIARSMEVTGGGMTQTGALVGTPEYMSPEQAKGEKLDARTDIFALGIIFYELLTGDSPYKADTAMASLYKRTVESPRPPIELNPDIPRPLSNIVVHCLQIDKEKRYASTSEILQDLAIAQGTRPGTLALPATPPTALGVWARSKKWVVGGTAVALSALAIVVYVEKFRRSAKPVAAAPAVSLAILPFSNASGDAKLDWLGPSLADMLSTDVGQSLHVRVISPNRLYQIQRDLQLSADSFSDQANVRRLADMSSADTVVWGKYAKAGDRIRLDATLRDIKRDRSVSFTAEAAGQNGLSPAIDHLAQTIRDNLSVKPNVVGELKAQSFKPASTSLDALRFYSEGTALSRQGKNLEALKRFQAATQADPGFALAYARLGRTYANLGHDAEAEQASRKAVDLAENLPAREKYLIAANYAHIEHDYPKAIQYYENLAANSPDDPEIQFALGSLYEDTGTFDKARDHYAKALASYPNDVKSVLALGRIEIKSDNPQGALDHFNRALTLSSQLGNDETKAMALQGLGLSYRQLDKRDEALRNFQQALEIRRRLGDKRGVAVTLNVVAQIEDQNGKSDQAVKAYQEALSLRREIGDKSGLGDTLLDLGTFYNYRGRYDDALKYFKQSLQVERELGDENSQGMCLNNIGTCYLSKGDFENAVTYFQQALELRQKSQVPADIALTLHNLAVASEKMGQYDKALNYYVRALDLYRNAGDKRGAATELYTMGILFGYQGRFGAAINAKQEALKNFTDLGDRTFWMTEAQSGYGKALADVGRFDEAQKPLDDALALARELKIDGSIAQALDFQGECLFYRGDFKGALGLYNEALQFASRSNEQEKILLSRFHISQTNLIQGRASEAATALRKLVGQADALGMTYLSFEASVSLGEALVESKDYAGARRELERASAGAEKLELRAVLAQANYWLGTALRLDGHRSQATAHYDQALQYLGEIRKDAGSDAFLQRSDLKAIYLESARWSKARLVE
jgi:eukaryotic-like serine/threonine-protein kinase